MKRARVVVVGGGFAGLTLAQKLKDAPVDIVLVDKSNHHLFQPLLYQVAVSALSPGDVATPLRTVFRRQKNVEIRLDEVLAVDREKREVHLRSRETLSYDWLVLAPGNEPTYFGNDHWRELAPGLKTIEDALTLREKQILSLEMALCVSDPYERRRLLTTVVVGGGPTGVEMAGSLAEIARKNVEKDFRGIRAEEIRVILIDGGERLLAGFPEELSLRTLEDLQELGVEVRLNTRVEKIEEDAVWAAGEQIPAGNVVWAAGNVAAPLLQSLNCELDRSGRAKVNPDLSLPGDRRVFVLGDAMCFSIENGTLPGVAQVAMQSGAYVAEIIKDNIPPDRRPPFKYFDKGSMATIGRARAVAQIGKFKFGGFVAWAIWALIHVAFLIQFRSRVRVMVEWMWYYLTFSPGARLLYRYRIFQDRKKR